MSCDLSLFQFFSFLINRNEFGNYSLWIEGRNIFSQYTCMTGSVNKRWIGRILSSDWMTKLGTWACRACARPRVLLMTRQNIHIK